MEYNEIVDKLLEQQYEEICRELTQMSQTDPGIVPDAGSLRAWEDSAYMVIASKKQELMLKIQQDEDEILVIQIEAWQGMVNRLQISIQGAFEEAKRRYQPILTNDMELRTKFWELTNIAIPDCENFKSPYMRQYFPTFAQYSKKHKERKKHKHRGSTGNNVLEQIKMVATLECLFDLKRQISNAFEDAKKKLAQQQSPLSTIEGDMQNQVPDSGT